MRGLIEKDLRLTLVRKQTIAIFLIMALFMGLSMKGSFVVSYVTMLAMIIATSTISYDEYDNGMAFIFTLPFDRRTYIREKYIFNLIMALGALIFGILIYGILDLIRNNGAGLVEIPMLVPVVPCIYMVAAIMIPLQLYFGTEKSRLALAVLFGAIVVVVMTGSSVIKSSVNPLAAVARALDGLPVAASILLVFAGAAILTGISYLCSVRIIEKKEF